MKMSAALVRVIPNDKLFVSEPNPIWFGNGRNPKNDPSWTNENWLKSRFHFSFAEYRNFKNLDYGVLRVCNDDLVQPHRGFGEHPHSNAEIITYVVEGNLTHQDTMGNKESLGRGSIQFMTAGSGIRHSEFNEGDKPLRFIQTWIKPAEYNLEPKYGSYRGDAELRKNKLQHLVSDCRDTYTKTPVAVTQDVNAFASELEQGHIVTHDLPADRQAYLLCIEGGVTVNGKSLQRHDACEITGGGPVEIVATDTEKTETGNMAHVLMFTMAKESGSGRRDF